MGTEREEVVAYPETAVLDIHQVADWLQVSVRTVERLDIPCTFLGHRTKRYLGKDVIEYMNRRKAS